MGQMPSYEDRMMQMESILKDCRIAELEARLEQAKPYKRKGIPNPNKAFEEMAAILDSQYADVTGVSKRQKVVEVESDESSGEEGGDRSEEEVPGPRATRSGRQVSKPSRYRD